MGLGNLAVACLGITTLFIVGCCLFALRRYKRLEHRLERRPVSAEIEKLLDPVLFFGLGWVVSFWGIFAIVAALGTQVGLLRQ